MKVEQTEFPFAAEIEPDRLAGHQAWCERNPHIKPAIIARMREVLAAGGKPSVDGALYHLREQWGKISNEHRAIFTRQIKAECPDLAPHLHPRSETPRKPRRRAGR